MSGLARAAKKHWKRVIKTVKRYWKIVAIAVVAYFTFGLALGAMAPAAGTVAAGTGAAATGAGVMTATGAAAGSAAAAGTAAATVAGIETVTVTAAAAGGGFSAAAGAAGAAAAGGAAASSMAGKPTGDVPNQQPVKSAEPVKPVEAPKASMLDKAKGAWKDMTFSDKLLLAKSGVDVVSAATAPSAEEEAAAAAKWQGAFYGRTAGEADQFVKQQGQATKVQSTAPKQREIVPGQGPMGEVPTGSPANPQALPPTQLMDFQSTAQQKPEQPAPEAEQVTNMGGNRDLFAQRAKGVRYLV